MKQLLLLFIILSSFCLSIAQISEPPSLTCVRDNGVNTELYWGLPVTNCAGGFNSYDIFRASSRSGPYTLALSLNDPTETFVSLPNPAVGTVSYYYMVSNRNCPAGTTFPTSDTLDNLRPKFSPRILSVTVNDDDDIEITWEADRSPEVLGYLIYNDNNGFNEPDTVYGRGNTIFLDSDADPFFKTNRYFIRTFELCENDTGFIGSSFTDSSRVEIHSSILLKYGGQVRCERIARIAWNKYNNYGYQGGVLGYVILVDEDGLGYTAVDTVYPLDSLYSIQGIAVDVVYNVKVIALLPGGHEAFSNFITFTGQTAPVPINFHIYNATPVEDGTIEVSYHNESPLAVKELQMQRSFNGINFDNINGREQTAPGAIIRIFKDGTGNPNNRAVFYRFIIRDSCDVIYNSGVINTVHLAGKELKNGGISLLWNPFNVSDGAADRYDLVKYVNGIEVSRLPLSTTTLTFLDANPFVLNQLDTVCYQLEVPFTVNMGSFSADNITVSNTVCFTPEPKAYVPNAFKPNGIQPENRAIGANLTYATEEGFLFQIFNRYGEMMFNTDDRTQRWDGFYKGNPSPMDGYIYVVKFQGLDGKERTKTGVIMLLR
jgi:gliding motility-associated-like protein